MDFASTFDKDSGVTRSKVRSAFDPDLKRLTPALGSLYAARPIGLESCGCARDMPVPEGSGADFPGTQVDIRRPTAARVPAAGLHRRSSAQTRCRALAADWK